MGNTGQSHYFLHPKAWEIGTLARRSSPRKRTSPNTELQPPDNKDITCSYYTNSPRVCAVLAARRTLTPSSVRVHAAYLQHRCWSARHGAAPPCKLLDWWGTWYQSPGDMLQGRFQHTVQPGIAAGGSTEISMLDPFLASCFSCADCLTCSTTTSCRIWLQSHKKCDTQRVSNKPRGIRSP